MNMQRPEGENFTTQDKKLDDTAPQNIPKPNVSQMLENYKRVGDVSRGNFTHDAYAQHQMRIMEAALLTASSANASMIVTRDRVQSIGKTGLDAANDPDVVAAISQDTATQEAVLNGKKVELATNTREYILKRAEEAEAKSGFQRDAGDLIYLREASRLKKEETLTKEDEVDMSYVEMAEGVPYGTYDKSSIVKTLSAKERNELENPELTFSKADSLPIGTYEAQSIRNTQQERNNTDDLALDLSLASNQHDQTRDVNAGTNVGGPTLVDIASKDEADLHREIKSIEIVKTTPDIMGDVREAEPRVENILSRLNGRKGKSLERLKNFGLNGLVKGLETVGKLSPKKRLFFGVAFAGLSVATGGVPAFVLMSVSTMSFASTIYKKNIEKIEKKYHNETIGDTDDVVSDEIKRKAAIRATVFGILAALATGYVISQAVDAVQAAGSAIADGFNSLTQHDVANSSSPSVAAVEAVSTPAAQSPVPSIAPVAAESVLVVAPLQEVAQHAAETVSHVTSSAPTPVPNLAEIAQNVQQQIIDAGDRAYDASRGITRQ